MPISKKQNQGVEEINYTKGIEGIIYSKPEN